MLAIGLNSGSSFDGVDAVLVEISFGEDDQLNPPKYIDGISLEWPEEIQESVLSAFSNTLTLFELTRLNYTVGAVFAQAATELMSKHGLVPEDVAVIGFDGQTVYQEPPEPQQMPLVASEAPFYKRWTEGGHAVGLQTGEPGVVAVLTDVPVVTQFRSVDHALGGTGAPLMQFLDYVAFKRVAPIATLNIGGISNVQIAHEQRSRMLAFDCGPGNVMIDHAMRKHFGAEYDAGGETASRGEVSSEMLRHLLEHPFFARPVPRCAWRLDFGAEYADAVLEEFRDVPAEDQIATLTRFSAEAIVRSLQANVEHLDEIGVIVASGGGVRNATLLQEISDLLPRGIELRISDEYGMPAQFKEAIKFATLAVATMSSIGNNIPNASGATRFGVLGKFVQAPRNARLVE